ATLCDTNAELVNVYRVVRDRVGALVKALRYHRYEKTYYYAVRSQDPATLDPVDRAARTIFLNRCGFNGLYRLNKAGKFNVPFGRYRNPTICDEPNLRACAAALSGVELIHSSYEYIVDAAEPGDFVYFDPPYHPVSKTANFTAYVAGGFSDEDQVRLSIVYKALTLKGVNAMLSNSSTPLIHELYGDHEIRLVEAPRAVNSNPARRGKVPEVVVLNYVP
ncbi:MAG: Dam family site-specific DNA-(adenine-N6)-methyltransferase, partial [Myxococcales bacterium]|nr:Dam family site-specific DNA-(adenine-N6)-methyltransferase [Myxococcales bacterium]